MAMMSQPPDINNKGKRSTPAAAGVRLGVGGRRFCFFVDKPPGSCSSTPPLDGGATAVDRGGVMQWSSQKGSRWSRLLSLSSHADKCFSRVFLISMHQQVVRPTQLQPWEASSFTMPGKMLWEQYQTPNGWLETIGIQGYDKRLCLWRWHTYNDPNKHLVAKPLVPSRALFHLPFNDFFLPLYVKKKKRERTRERKLAYNVMAATLPGASSMVLFFLLSLVAATEALDVPTLTFGEGFSHLFGNDNLIRSADDRSVRLTLNRYSGRGRDVLVATFVVFFL
ncbi:hypothetical protein BHE74_00043048 [Ensete ventricosum]|nr:hypothetical protein BHE74_00043048 [Ensete ventricosum]